MRVYVEHDMTVNHNTSVMTLKAGQIVEGPLAVFLVESDCDVTIEQDDRPAADPAPIVEGEQVVTPQTEETVPPEGESHTPGTAEQPDAEVPAEAPAEAAAEPTAEPSAAE
jgi:hypothetical protein